MSSPGGCLATFSPDSTRTGRYRVALDHLRSLGLEIHGCRWIRVTLGQVDDLYADNRAAHGTARAEADRLVDELFTSDWCLSCFVRAPHLSAGTIWDLMTVLKGNADPAAIKPGHLRALLGAENKVMNGVHVGDSAEVSQREAEILGLDHGESRERSLPPVPADLVATASCSALYVGYCLRFRLLKRYVCDAEPPMRDLMAKERSLTADPNKPARVLARLHVLREEIAAQLLALGIDRALRERAQRVGHVCATSFDVALLDAELDDGEVALTAWERLVLRCQQDQGPLPHW
jgi:nucleoside diphosphate kinase